MVNLVLSFYMDKLKHNITLSERQFSHVLDYRGEVLEGVSPKRTTDHEIINNEEVNLEKISQAIDSFFPNKFSDLDIYDSKYNAKKRKEELDKKLKDMKKKGQSTRYVNKFIPFVIHQLNYKIVTAQIKDTEMGTSTHAYIGFIPYDSGNFIVGAPYFKLKKNKKNKNVLSAFSDKEFTKNIGFKII